jgi:hypothetical protein
MRRFLAWAGVLLMPVLVLGGLYLMESVHLSA